VADANETVIELVKFTSEGLDDIEAQTKAVEEAVKRAYAAQLAQNLALRDPAVRRAAQDVARLAKENRGLLDTTEQLTAADKLRLANQDRIARISSGAFRKEAATLADLRREKEKIGRVEKEILRDGERRARADRRADFRSGAALADLRGAARGTLRERIDALRVRGQALASGDYASAARRSGHLAHAEARAGLGERAALLGSGEYSRGVARRESLRAQEAVLAAAERKTELQTIHGRRVGGALYGLERARPGLLAAGAAGAAGVGMARSGFAGTVEGNALAMEMHLLNREIAAALLPVLKDLTSAVRFVRKKFEGLSETGQDVVGYGIAGAVGLGALGAAAGTISKVAGGLSKIGRVLGLGGAAGGTATAAAGSMIGEVVGTAGATAAGTTLAKSGGKAAGRMRYVKGVGWVAVATAAAARLASMDEGEGKSIYQLQREAGGSKVTAGAISTMAGIVDFFGGSDITKTFGMSTSADYKRELAGQKVRDLPDSHRNAHIADAGFEGFDETYQRVATATALQAATEQGPGGALAAKGQDPAQKSADTLDIILQLLQSVVIPGTSILPPLR